jgi:ADP-ribose pyrophosphatase YjhB (NUDIX family)
MRKGTDGSLVHEWFHDGCVTRMTWIGDADVVPARAYALAFTADGMMLLVSGGSHNPDYWLPGGGIEDGEDEEVALRRELQEEAGASITDLTKLGVQMSEDELLGRQFQSFYWARVTLDPDSVPETEVEEFCLVTPDRFLDVLFWGRDDPKAEMLLARALEIERSTP